MCGGCNRPNGYSIRHSALTRGRKRSADDDRRITPQAESPAAACEPNPQRCAGLPAILSVELAAPVLGAAERGTTMAMASNIGDFFDMGQQGDFSKRILVEGDSWVSQALPGMKNLATQVNRFRPQDYLILNIASPGDEAAEIFTPEGRQMKRLNRLLSTEQWGAQFDLILLSAAGNDIVGPEIWKKGYVLNKRDCPSRYGKDLITDIFYRAMDDIAAGYRHFLQVKEQSARNRHAPVLTHTYSYLKPREVGTRIGPVMSGKGWVKIHLKHQGIKDKHEQYAIVVEMLDAFHRSIKPLEAEFSSFLVVDTREVLLKQGKPNLSLWRDEIHPNSKGFRKLAKHIRRVARQEGLWLPE